MLERGGLLFPNESVVFREKVSNQYEREEDGSWRIKLQTEFTILVGCSFFIYPVTREGCNGILADVCEYRVSKGASMSCWVLSDIAACGAGGCVG